MSHSRNRRRRNIQAAKRAGKILPGQAERAHSRAARAVARVRQIAGAR